MSRNRWLPALLAATTLFAGCAGGSAPTALPLQQGASNPEQHFRTTAPPAASAKKIHDAIGAFASPTWQLLEPLDISNSGTFSPARNGNNCSPTDPLFGQWYIALGSFTLPLNGVSLPSCSTAPTPPWQPWNVKKKHSTNWPAPPASYNNLYIVQLSLVGFSANVTPIAGPAITTGSTSYFQPMESLLSFGRGRLYSFFVASYTGPTFAQPAAACQIGATACSLGANPITGNKLVAVVSDGSGQLPSLVVKDSAGNALTQETISPNCGHCVAVYDETAASGITGTVTYTTSGGGAYYPYESAIYELANVTAGRFAGANTAGIPPTLAATIPGVTNNDVQLCAFIQTGTNASNLALGFSNGSSESYDYQSTVAVFAREIATATASSTCTANAINAGYEAGMAYADYP